MKKKLSNKHFTLEIPYGKKRTWYETVMVRNGHGTKWMVRNGHGTKRLATA